MKDNPDRYFERTEVINFDINHQCRGDKLQRMEKEYKMLDNADFKDYPKEESKEVASAVFRSKTDDLLLRTDLMLKHLKENF